MNAPGKTSRARLVQMIEEAIVDTYGEEEQAAGSECLLAEHLEVPFTTKVLGVEVSVERIELRDDMRIVAICVHGRTRQPTGLLDLPLPSPPPAGAEWIAAYRHFLGGGR